jgi:hypothetical protein
MTLGITGFLDLPADPVPETLRSLEHRTMDKAQNTSDPECPSLKIQLLHILICGLVVRVSGYRSRGPGV